MYEDDKLLPLSALQHVQFCERRAALVHLECIWQDNVFTAEGTVGHERVHSLTKTEVRGDLRIARGLLIRSLQLGLSGKADVVEFHRVEVHPGEKAKDSESTSVRLPGVSGLWRPYPVEYKRGRLRSNRSFEVQVCAQAMCLEEMLQTTIERGAIFFGETARRLELKFDTDLRSETVATAFRLHEIMNSGITPPAKFENKCKKCSLLDVCMPKITGHRSKVETYLRRTIREAMETNR
ncbi:CRISPR-associated protein Cas4 [Desulfomonile tiedjei]|uniref:CRISPR-associated exonuclease Cas4 n=1 Tax=Desulfomonile tiedjei (strain ATCC 49306 / DSM 6799 / DCB-1) TaxID=706587 RepID=I4C1T1_DESTA|nr:CRISPR-associated protein Cas4 [Desulfomonile tiedjei]AFM23522.1 CRISPR-associated exonuclease, Cas4 family [Desulfomonile tiedjei DSM 6799]